MDSATDRLLTAKELAPLIGLSTEHGWRVALRWFREGRFPAAINEPRCVRFDLAEVKTALKARAKKNAKR